MISAPNTPAVVLIATNWGRRHGGVNSFSTDLSTALAGIADRHRVVCVALSADEADRADAASAGVTLLNLHLDSSGSADHRYTSQVFGVLAATEIATVDHWIGHDVLTGELAVCCARDSKQGIATVLMHMSYTDYLYVKHPASEGTTIAERAAKQKAVLRSADFACAVGPLLFQRLHDIRGDDSIIQLVPGMAQDVFARPSSTRLQAIGLGRFAAADALVKQAPLAAAGFARAFRKGLESRNPVFRDAQLTLVGVPRDEARDLRDLADTEAGRVVNIQTVDFIESRERLLGILCEANACLMLSWHEGFGLAAWEAIGAGVPVILSKNSGVFRLLESVGGAATGCVTSIDIRGRSDGAPQEQDIESVMNALLEVAGNIPASLANAESLRHLLREREFTWERTARTMAELIGLPIAAPVVKIRADTTDVEMTTAIQRPSEAARRRQLFARRIGYQPDPFFKGREAELEQLIQGLKERKSLQIRSVIWGMGGVGKTALAVQLCHQLIADDVFADGILWYRVRQESVAEVIKRCTIDLDIDPTINAITDLDARVAEFQHRLRKLDLLIVLDNADYGPEVMRPIFDLFRGTPLLITSRREFDLPGSIRVPLGDLKPEEAVALVRDLLGISCTPDHTPSGPYGSVADVEELCQAVSCLPIALVLATAYIRERRLPVRQYIAAWRTRRDRLRLLAADRIDVKEERLRDVRACFGMSFDDLDARAQRVLAYMGLWGGRDFSLAHLANVIDEAVYAEADGHDGAITVACELPGGALGVTGGEDGRVLIWDISKRQSPRTLLTAFHVNEPIADLIVGPEGRQLLIQTDAGSIAIVASVDIVALRVAHAAVLSLRVQERMPLALPDDGVPVIQLVEGRLQFRLRLAWPSLQSPEKLPELDASCQIVPEGAGEGPSLPSDPAWRRKISQAWRPRPRARVGIKARDYLASIVLSRVKAPDLPEPRTGRETLLLAQNAEHESLPAWKTPDKAEQVLSGLAAVARLLQQRSLVDNLQASDSERVRVHPLVSEFAAEHLSAEERDRAVPALSRFYLERMQSSRKHFDADEANIEFSLLWALQNWTPEQLIDNNDLLMKVNDALEYRGRYSLALRWSEAYVQAAQHGADLQQGRAWSCHAYYLSLCGRRRESSKALARGRQLLERGSLERPILADEDDWLWWVWCSAQYERWMGSQTRDDASAETSRRVRQARMVSVNAYYWSRTVAQDWADRRSRKAHAAKEELIADSLWNRRNRIQGFAEEYGDVEDLLSAHDQLRALTTEELSEAISYSAQELRLKALLAAGDLQEAFTCLDALRKLAARMPREATQLELLLGQAQLALRQGRAPEASELWERAQVFLEQPAVGPPAEWFWQAYFRLADAKPQAAATVLQEVRHFWPSLSSSERCAYHYLAAWALTALGNQAHARVALARAEAHNRRFACVPPWHRKMHGELYAVGSVLGIAEGDVTSANESLWGAVENRPYILVRGPDILLEERPRDKPDAKPDVLGLVEPLHLRNRPATVGELREHCAARGTPLPWYYRVHRPDIDDSDWARFVSYSLALTLARDIDEDLPGTLGWRSLPDDRAWRLSIPAASTALPPPVSIDEWVEQSPAWAMLTNYLLRPGEIAPGDLPVVRAALCADPMSALDKWRVIDIVRRAGLEALPPRLASLAGIASARQVPSPLASGVLARLERDWRSIAYLAGFSAIPADAVWLRPETRKPHKTFGTIEHMGAIGTIVREGAPGPCLLVPDSCAWADVLVWPSRLFDPTWYREEAPPWP